MVSCLILKSLSHFDINFVGGVRGFPGGACVKNLPTNAGDAGLILELEKSSGEENGNPLQYSGLDR